MQPLHLFRVLAALLVSALLAAQASAQAVTVVE